MFLLKTLLYQWLFPRQQCYQLHMGRVDRIDVFAIFNEIVVCGNISTISYVRGNISTNRTVYKKGTLARSEEHTSELQSRGHLVCRLLLEKKNGTDHRVFSRR